MIMEPEVQAVVEIVPEFVDRYLDLVDAADEEPGAAATFNELAEFVACLAGTAGKPQTEGVLRRCFEGVEKVACESEDAEELVGWAFLDTLSPTDLERLRPWLGPKTLALTDELRAHR